MQHCDAIIIGAGQSGFPLAGHLPGAGWKTALIEADVLGGTCVNTGCTPTKTIIASAHAIHMARRGEFFGFSTGPVEVDMRRIKERAQERIMSSRTGLQNWLENLDGLDVIYGRGELEGPNTVRVNGELLQAEHIIINTGTRPNVPPIDGLDTVAYMTSDDLLQLDFVPEHLVIVGGSYIGLEFAQAYRRFGSRVTIVEMAPVLIGREDPDISEAVRSIMENEGIDVRTSSTCIAVENRDGRIAVKMDCADDEKEVVGTHLLLATGRKPNSDIGLERAGVEVTKRGYVVVDERLQTNVPNIWATGDVNGRGAFTHTSWNDYEVLVDVLLGDDVRRVGDRVLTYALFIDPPLGRVGMTERQAREAGHEVLVASKPMRDIGRAIEKGETQGLMKFLVDAQSHRFLGAAVLGTGGDEIIGSVTNLIYADAPYTVFKDAVHAHPTVTELIPTTLGSLQPLGERA
ncbi:MAG: FAD-containing oxidoreductase [Chloroflexi bacterium]|nr:FAD-containing oxidoreductase [Chloroflexota bacterium]